MKKCVLIYNPNSGKGRARVEKNIEKIKQKFFLHGYELEVIPTKYKGHASSIVKELKNIDLVVSIGGDGTFSEVMNGNFKRKNKILLSHIPIGTANDLGNMFGYGKNLLKNIDLLLNGSVKNIDICTINGQPFSYCAAFGNFVNISYETPRSLKKKIGYLAYLVTGFKNLLNKNKIYDVEYKVNGKKYKNSMSFVIMSNSSSVAGIKNLYKNVKIDDNVFEVLICSFNKKIEIIKILYYLFSRKIYKSSYFKCYKTSDFKIKFKNNGIYKWSIDGEKYETNNICDIKIEKNLEMIIPNKNISTLFKVQ